MGKKRQKIQTPEEAKAITISHVMDGLDNIPADIPSHRRFKVGDKVRVGNLEKAVVEDVLEGGRIYLIQHKDGRNDDCLTAFSWMSVKPADNQKKTDFSDSFDLKVSCSNTFLDGLIGKVYYFGVDFNPPYQRGLVWTQDQKEALIKTIFDYGSIGTFAFNRRPYTKKPLFEVIDGKQRLSTLCEFYEDRWPYNGVYYSELSNHDTVTFRMTSVLEIALQEATEEAKLRLFLRINRAGTPVDTKHIAHVQAMLAVLEKSRASD